MKDMKLWNLLVCVSCVCCEPLLIQDLLSAPLSPAALMAPSSPSWNSRSTASNQSVTDGDLNQALPTMLFHRSKMNEYLCHSYLADEILQDLSSRRPGLERRSGEAADQEGASLATPQDLLADPGSTSYKEWLDKSAKAEEMYETGDVTGFATMHGGGGGGGGKGYDYPPPSQFSWNGGEGAGNDVWSGGQDMGWHDNSGQEVSGWGWEDQDSGKGLALKELFDLALTALAFLAFGVFVLNLIMTCFAKTPEVTVVWTNSTTAAPSGRRKRDVNTNHLNELAYRVLTSVDKLLELQDRANQTQDACLEYTLCDNNKYSRALNDKNRIWLPVWSLGMSWMAGQSGLSSIDHIRAAVLGLGNAECAELYPQCTRTASRAKRRTDSGRKVNRKREFINYL